LDNPSALNLDESFLEKLDSFSGCNLPLTLKNNICCLIQKFCFNCGVSINMNVQSINSLPDDLKATFCALLKHVYSIDSHSKNLVLDLIKLLADSFGDDDLGTAPSGSGPHGNSPVFKDDGEINAGNRHCFNFPTSFDYYTFCYKFFHFVFLSLFFQMLMTMCLCLNTSSIKQHNVPHAMIILTLDRLYFFLFCFHVSFSKSYLTVFFNFNVRLCFFVF